MNYRIIFMISALLSVMCLFTPFVWMEIGPLGHQYYGPTVPDVYIYGGYITGKDTGFWGIAFAMTFQLAFILLFSSLSLIAFFLKTRVVCVITLFFQLILLTLFPIWLNIYMDGIRNNSDAADLTVHYSYGMVIYAIIIACTLLELTLIFRSKSLK